MSGMGEVNFLSYWNPWDKHFEQYDFHKLQPWQKVVTSIMTFLAIFVFGIGALPSYRFFLKRFSVIDPNKVDNNSPYHQKTARRLSVVVDSHFKSASDGDKSSKQSKSADSSPRSGNQSDNSDSGNVTPVYTIYPPTPRSKITFLKTKVAQNKDAAPVWPQGTQENHVPLSPGLITPPRVNITPAGTPPPASQIFLDELTNKKPKPLDLNLITHVTSPRLSLIKCKTPSSVYARAMDQCREKLTGYLSRQSFELGTSLQGQDGFFSALISAYSACRHEELTIANVKREMVKKIESLEEGNIKDNWVQEKFQSSPAGVSYGDFKASLADSESQMGKTAYVRRPAFDVEGRLFSDIYHINIDCYTTNIDFGKNLVGDAIDRKSYPVAMEDWYNDTILYANYGDFFAPVYKTSPLPIDEFEEKKTFSLLDDGINYGKEASSLFNSHNSSSNSQKPKRVFFSSET